MMNTLIRPTKRQGAILGTLSGKAVPILMGLLMLQVMIALIAWGVSFFASNHQINTHETTRLHFPIANVSEININSGEGQVLKLVKVDGRWTMPDYNNLLADGDKINALLSVFTQPQHFLPLSNTAEANRRYGLLVQPNNAVSTPTIVNIYADNGGEKKSKTLFLGHALSERSIAVRIDNEQAVYELSLPTPWGITVVNKLKTRDFARAGGWLDYGQLQLANHVHKIEGKGYTLTRSQDRSFTLSPLAVGEKMHPANIKKLVEALTEILIADIASNDWRKKVDARSPSISFVLHYQQPQKTVEMNTVSAPSLSIENETKRKLIYDFYEVGGVKQKGDDAQLLLDFGADTKVWVSSTDSATIRSANRKMLLMP